MPGSRPFTGRKEGFLVSQGKRALSTERKAVIVQFPTPSTRRELCEFLRAAGFCRIWIPGFAAPARPLYQALKGPDIKPLDWGLEEERAFQDIKKCIGCAPALGLPDPS